MNQNTEEKDKIQKRNENKDLEQMALLMIKNSTFTPNIPYSPVYLALIDNIRTDFDISKYNSEEALRIKIFVNKKCNQISTDFAHTRHIVEEIVSHRDNPLFIEIFIRKLLDQGRVQVSGHFESYKPLSYILYRFNNNDIINLYIKLLLSKKGSESELKGMYAIYFGYLNIKESIDECWLWLSSILNVSPNQYSGYILEVFMSICSGLLLEKIPAQYKGALKYIKDFYILEINNKPVETRILNQINSYLGQ